MPFLQLAGLPLYYELHGPVDSEQPLVVLFNGWLLSARYWQETVQRLEKQHPLLLFDSRGFGRSRPSGSGYAAYHANIDSGVEETQLLLEKLNLAGRRYHVVGHSLGAVTAAHFAALAEARGQLTSLTIINSGSFDDNEPQGNRLATFFKLFVKIKGFFNLPLVRVAVVGRSVARPIPGRYALNITEDFTLADERLALEISLSSVDAKVLARYRNELKQLKAPLLLLVGDRDATIPPKGMYNIKKFKPEARLAAFSDCGHLPMLERPADFCQTLASHFEQAELTNLSNQIMEV
jgi:pimeloyl-ACP methyl ester carboxylesterase